MANLFCLGLGYSAEHYVAEYGARFAKVSGSVRTAEKAAHIASGGFGGRPITAHVFNGHALSRDVSAALRDADHLLVSIGPDRDGDPALRAFADDIAAAPLSAIVYLSTVGVYGDHAGAWIDESAGTNPLSLRSRERLDAERAWQVLATRRDTPLAILRLAGIYGPGQNALENVRHGTAKRIIRPGQVFNRIHVEDIAQTIEAAFVRRARGVFNVADDEPSPGQDVVTLAATLLGVTPPPEIPFDEAAKTMTPMGLSFYGEVKRVRNAKIKRELGVTLRYPTYREGIGALHASHMAETRAS